MPDIVVNRADRMAESSNASRQILRLSVTRRWYVIPNETRGLTPRLMQEAVSAGVLK
jgi:hypothetical protein